MVPVLPVLLKLTAMYEFAAPLNELKGPGVGVAVVEVPWNQLSDPTGVLLFCITHPLPARVEMSLKLSVNVWAKFSCAQNRKTDINNWR